VLVAVLTEKGMSMEHKEKEIHLTPAVSTEIFSVWCDEGGQPKFLDDPEVQIPSEYFVHVDAGRAPVSGDYLLVSDEGKMFFARLDSRPGWLFRLDRGERTPFDPSLLVLGVVVSGFEWFTVDEIE